MGSASNVGSQAWDGKSPFSHTFQSRLRARAKDDFGCIVRRSLTQSVGRRLECRPKKKGLIFVNINFNEGPRVIKIPPAPRGAPGLKIQPFMYLILSRVVWGCGAHPQQGIR